MLVRFYAFNLPNLHQKEKEPIANAVYKAADLIKFLDKEGVAQQIHKLVLTLVNDRFNELAPELFKECETKYKKWEKTKKGKDKKALEAREVITHILKYFDKTLICSINGCKI